MKPPKRSKELSKQDKDGNPIWLKPERSKELELLVKGFYLGAYCDGGQGVDVRHDYIEKAITAIEKWAKEKYAPKPIKDTEA